MPKFKYTAKSQDGKTVTGTVEAAVKSSAIQSLRAKGLVIISLEEQRRIFSLGNLIPRRKGIRVDELAIFSRQLATMVDAGIPLAGALDILSEQIEQAFFKKVIIKVHDDIETGSSLSEALAKHPKIFSPLFINMVKAGETSGMLDEILDRLALYLEKTSGLQRRVKSALVYPAAVTVMAIIITIFLLMKVIPVFKEIYAGFGAKLPAPTEMVIRLSDFIRHYFVISVILVAVLIFLFIKYAKTEKGAKMIDGIKLKLPIVGTIVRKIAVGKFTRTFSTLIKSGVPILSALEIVSKTSGNRVIEMAVDNVRTSVKEGESITEPLSRSRVFPPMVIRMISVGEETGELEKMLTKISDFYDEQVDAAVSGLTSLIEPLIIAFLGVIIGGLVVCMFLPILKISTIVSM